MLNGCISTAYMFIQCSVLLLSYYVEQSIFQTEKKQKLWFNILIINEITPYSVLSDDRWLKIYNN